MTHDHRGPHDHRSGRCRDHGLTHDRFVGQLVRLLDGSPREREVYRSLVADVVAASDPRELFGPRRLRSGAQLVEALYETYRTLPESGGTPLLPPLAYARWLTWRRLQDEVRAGTAHCREIGRYLGRSRLDVTQHLRNGWRPDPRPDDLAELLNNL